MTPIKHNSLITSFQLPENHGALTLTIQIPAAENVQKKIAEIQKIANSKFHAYLENKESFETEFKEKTFTYINISKKQYIINLANNKNILDDLASQNLLPSKKYGSLCSASFAENISGFDQLTFYQKEKYRPLVKLIYQIRSLQYHNARILPLVNKILSNYEWGIKQKIPCETYWQIVNFQIGKENSSLLTPFKEKITEKLKTLTEKLKTLAAPYEKSHIVEAFIAPRQTHLDQLISSLFNSIHTSLIDDEKVRYFNSLIISSGLECGTTIINDIPPIESNLNFLNEDGEVMDPRDLFNSGILKIEKNNLKFILPPSEDISELSKMISTAIYYYGDLDILDCSNKASSNNQIDNLIKKVSSNIKKIILNGADLDVFDEDDLQEVEEMVVIDPVRSPVYSYDSGSPNSLKSLKSMTIASPNKKADEGAIGQILRMAPIHHVEVCFQMTKEDRNGLLKAFDKCRNLIIADDDEEEEMVL